MSKALRERIRLSATRRRLAAFCAVLAAGLALQACGEKARAPTERLALDAPLPEAVPPGVKLVIGDPQTQAVLEHLGWDKELPFKVEWAELQGGPQVTEAFHAKALDVGSAANVPPIHAVWAGIPVKTVAIRVRKEPLEHQSWSLGISPKAKINTLADLRGKKIAFSAGQVQGEIVLRTLKDEGIPLSAVTLVELPSTGDVYINALVAGLVDAAPLGAGTGISQRYMRDFARDGAKLLQHGPFRDDLSLLYVRTEVLEDAGKAAALRAYVKLWARVAQWTESHPEEWGKVYFVKKQGLSEREAAEVVESLGVRVLPADWSEAIAYQQASIDILAGPLKHKAFDAAALFDRRFEAVIADASRASQAALPPPAEERAR